MFDIELLIGMPVGWRVHASTQDFECLKRLANIQSESYCLIFFIIIRNVQGCSFNIFTRDLTNCRDSYNPNIVPRTFHVFITITIPAWLRTHRTRTLDVIQIGYSAQFCMVINISYFYSICSVFTVLLARLSWWFFHSIFFLSAHFQIYDVHILLCLCKTITTCHHVVQYDGCN